MPRPKVFYLPDGKTRTTQAPRSPVEAPSGASGAVLYPRRPTAHGGTFSQLSVILALHGQQWLTARCLMSIRRDMPEAEVICVDNASPDGTADWLLEQEDVVSVLLTENRGCAGGWNIGLAEARGDVLLVLNNDTLVQPGGLRRLAQAAWETGIAALSGGILTPEVTYAGSRDDRPELTDYPEGVALAFRRDVWEQVGTFDEAFKLGYCEDSDWGLRARLAGFDYAFVPGAVTHFGQGTSRTVPGLAAAKAKNDELLRTRWRGQGVGERLTVKRWGALGDLVVLTPTLAALRRDYPLARIFLQCAPTFAAFWNGLSLLDGVTDVPVPETTRELAMDFAYEEQFCAGNWFHAVYHYAERAGVTLTNTTYHLPPTPELTEWAVEMLPGGPYVACGLRSAHRPKASWKEREWVALVRACPDRAFVLFDPVPQPGLEVFGGQDGTLYREPNVFDLTGKTPTPRHLLALLWRCATCVTVDTGVLHLASAVGLPLVALFGSTRPEGMGPLTGKTVIFEGKAPCFPCTFPTHCDRTDGTHCLDWVTGEQVAAALRDLEG